MTREEVNCVRSPGDYIGWEERLVVSRVHHRSPPLLVGDVKQA